MIEKKDDTRQHAARAESSHMSTKDTRDSYSVDSRK